MLVWASKNAGLRLGTGTILPVNISMGRNGLATEYNRSLSILVSKGMQGQPSQQEITPLRSAVSGR
jgi:hypothetical protein